MLIIPVENKPDWRHPPVVTLLLILINVWVFFSTTPDMLRWGLVPADPHWLNFLTNMFLHGGIDHLLGNMAFLFLFGFALERVLGPLIYAVVYVVGGLGGGLLHVLMHASSEVPVIGASGAVSALMGAYLAVYQLREIRFFYNFLFYFGEFRAPAIMILPLWLTKELYGYLFGIESVAYWAHIGGLVTGAVMGFSASRWSGKIDTHYLESSTRAETSRVQLERLDDLIDNFKFDQARAVAARHLADHPEDLPTWEKYLKLLASNQDDPQYHRAVKRTLQAALTDPSPEAAKLLGRLYDEYAAGTHPKPALQDVRLLCALGRTFAHHRQLDHARQVANALLKAKRKEPELAQLLTTLSDTLALSGSRQLAAHYRAERNARFPGAA